MPNDTLPAGVQIGPYRILSHIATGGMGAVYKARDEVANRKVAIKVLAPEMAHHPILLERFKREAKAAARLSHKNIVTLHEYAEYDGLHCIVMELIEGVDLSEYIRRKGLLDPEEARRILIQACKALDHAFQQGVTHRDIKPSNFLLANEKGRTRVKLTDMGLSRIVDEEEYRVTRAGTTVGTVDYMSPEQARDSSNADIRSDIYSLGCTFYHMLAGQPPFAEGGLGERIYKHIASDPPDVRSFNPRVPAPLWAILRRMLAKRPDDRYQTPADLIDALRTVADLADHQPEPETLCGVEGPPSSQEMALTPPPESPTTPPNTAQGTPSTVNDRPSSPEIVRPQKKRRTALYDQNTVADSSDPLGLSTEQRQTAAEQFAHATDLLRQDADFTYVKQILLGCCRLDPGNVLYRKMLRSVVRDRIGVKKLTWFSMLTTLSFRRRLRAAVKAEEYRRVLDEGEEFLSRYSGDVATQLDLAEAAKGLSLTSMVVWMLEEARQQAPADRTVLRTLAGVYEEQKQYDNAINVWEQVKKLDPTDDEAHAKIREIAVNQTLEKTRRRG